MSAPVGSASGPLQDCRLAVEGGSLAALRSADPGTGARVLALHGWLDNAASFVPLAAHLPGIDLVALDLPGHGRSDALPAGAEYSLAGTVHAVLDAADALGWDRFALLGHSMGASIGCLVAAAVPGRVTGLVAIEGLGALADTEDHTATRLREAVAARRALRGKRLRVFPDIDAAVHARMQASLIGERTLAEPLVRLLVERGLCPVEGGYTWSSDPRLTVSTPTRMTEGQVRDVLRSLACPVLAIHAEPAQPYFPESLRNERAQVPVDIRLVRLPGGHHLHMDQPGVVGAAVAGFLRGAPAVASASSA